MYILAIIQILLFVQYFLIATQQSIGLGKCPKLEVVQNFDVLKFTGVWYEQYRYFFVPEMGTTCNKLNLVHSEDGFRITVTLFDNWEKRSRSEKGIAKFLTSETEGKFLMIFASDLTIIFWILDTDYETYCVIWSCERHDGYHKGIIWIFTREQFPLRKNIEKALKVLKKRNLSSKYLFKIDHENCNTEEYEYDYYNYELNPEAEEIDL